MVHIELNVQDSGGSETVGFIYSELMNRVQD